MAKVWLSVLVLSVLLPTAAFAQAESPELEDGTDFGLDPELGDTNSIEDDEDASEGVADLPVDPNADQWFVGLQWRQLIIPAFVQQMFLDEAPTVFQPAIQVVATKRTSDNFSLVFGLGYASYAADGLYRAKGDPIEDTEWMESSLGLLHGTISALWATNINQYLDFEYGIGGELGIVTGELRRTEAQQINGSWSKCPGPTGSSFCGLNQVPYDEKGEHYNVVEERIPPVFLLPTLFQAGLRITPVPQVAIKIEAAYATAAFWFGASVHLNLNQL